MIYESFQDQETNKYSLKPYEFLSYLESLGHCEIDFKRRMVAICPPTVALIPSYGLPKAVLAGARDEETITRLSHLASNESNFQLTIAPASSDGNIPQRILIEATSISILRQVSKKLEAVSILDWPVAWVLVQSAPSISDQLASLKYELRTEPDWNKRFFHYNSLSFNLSDDRADIRLGSYTNPYTQQQVTWLWNGEEAVELDRNWGRYIMLHHKKVSILLYDGTSNKLAVPVTVPLPRDFAKSVTMCSGLTSEKMELPQNAGILPQGSPVQVYDSVPYVVANELASKLGQRLVYTNI